MKKLFYQTKATLNFFKPEYHDCLSSAKHGLERESVRIQKDGKMSLTPHPKFLGSSLKHPLIKTDFAESQIEYATNIHKSIPDALSELTDLHQFTMLGLGDELLWPFSMPPVLPADSKIPVGLYGTSKEGRKKEIYRKGLGNRYGRKMQTISGVHYNISFDTCLLSKVAELRYKKPLTIETKSEIYFDTIRNFYRLSPALIYLFGASSLVDQSFSEPKGKLKTLFKNTLGNQYATTLRLSTIGYTSKVQKKYPISVNSLMEYVTDMCHVVSKRYPPYSAFDVKKESQLNDFILQLENEYYSLVRPKQVPLGEERVVDALARRGVEYLEIRLLDLDPFSPIGVEENRLYFLHLILLYCMISESPKSTSLEMKDWQKNLEIVTWEGRKKDAKIKFNGKEIPIPDFIYQVLVETQTLVDLLDSNNGDGPYSRAWENQWEKWNDSSSLGSRSQILDLELNGFGFRELGLQLAKSHKKDLLQKKLNPKKIQMYEEMALKSLTEQMQVEDLEGSAIKKNRKPIVLKPLDLCSGAVS